MKRCCTLIFALLWAFAAWPALGQPQISGLSATALCPGDTLLVFGQNLSMPDLLEIATAEAEVLEANADTLWVLVPDAGSQTLEGPVRAVFGALEALSDEEAALRPLPPAPSITVVGQVPFCQGESAVLVASGGGAEYAWTLNGQALPAQGQVLEATQAGSYVVAYRLQADACWNASPQASLSVIDSTPVQILWPQQTVFTDARDTVALVAEPAGGVFSGEGVANNTFSPQFVGVENSPYRIAYTYTNADGCVSTAYVWLEVVDDANSIAGLGREYCNNADSVVIDRRQSFVENSVLLGLSNLTLPGEGVSPDTLGAPEYVFYPSQLPAGTYELEASYQDTLTQAVATRLQRVTVLELPDVSIIGLPADSICVNQEEETIILEASPLGGQFSGPGIRPAGNGRAVLDVEEAGVGAHDISYAYTNSAGCTGVGTSRLVIKPAPEVDLGEISDYYCYNADTVWLSSSVGAGTFSGEGVTDLGNGEAFFLASAAAMELGVTDSISNGELGIVFVRYEYTAENGCSVDEEAEVTIIGLFESYIDVFNRGVFVSADTVEICYSEEAIDMYGSPEPYISEGQTASYSGLGLQNQDLDYVQFNPDLALAQLGIDDPTERTVAVPIYYTMTDELGCRNRASTVLLMRPQPRASLATPDPQNRFCYNDLPVLLQSSPEADQIFSYAFFSFADENRPTNGLEDNFDGTAWFYPAAAASDMGAAMTDPATTHAIRMDYTDRFGCAVTSYDTLLVRPAPEVTLQGLDNAGVYCYSDSLYVLEGLPAGGVFGGPGVAAAENGQATWQPSAALAEAFSIGSPVFPDGPLYVHAIYTYSDTSGCATEQLLSLAVQSLPDVSIAGLEAYYCVTDDDDIVLGVPSQNGVGVFSGDIAVGTSQPGTAEIRPGRLEANGQVLSDTVRAEIRYAFTSHATGCTNVASGTTLIRPRPQATYAGGSENGQYCYDDPVAQLTLQPLPDGATTSGGFSGLGITDLDGVDGRATFSPSTGYDNYLSENPDAEVAVFPIAFLYEDAFGCELEAFDTLTVHPLPEVRVEDYNPSRLYCFSDAPDTLAGGPAGGQFSGPGVMDLGNGWAVFDPKMAFEQLGLDSLEGTGQARVRYRYTNGAGCTDSTEVTLLLRPIPPISNFADRSFCFFDSVLIVPSPGTQQGGTAYFMGDGLFDNGNGTAWFSARQAAAAQGAVDPYAANTIHTATYVYTNASGCTNRASVTYAVRPYTDVALVYATRGVGDSLRYCERDDNFEVQPSTTNDVASYAISGQGIFTASGGRYEFSPVSARQAAINANPDLARRPTSHTIRLVYTNQYGCLTDRRDTLRINPVPQVNFGVANQCGTEPIRFIDSTSTDGIVPTQWAWDFGDGSSSSLQAPEYRYAEPGLYAVRLTVTSSAGCGNSRTKPIGVGGKPTAAFTFRRQCQADTTLFNGGLSSVQNPVLDRIASWTWDFQDPNGQVFSQALSDTRFRFSEIGHYAVSLIVRTENGCADTVAHPVPILPNITADALTSDRPYLQDFEEDAGGWISEGTNNSWEWGEPQADGGFAQAASGSKAWATGLSAPYQADEVSYVNGPCFDFRNLDRPMISMQLWMDADSTRDGAVLQYSDNDGLSWTNVGDLNSPYNWYDAGVRAQPGGNSVGQAAWTGRYRGWRTARHVLDPLRGKSSVRFRIAFGSDASADGLGGMAFDQIWIGNRFKQVLVEHFTHSSSAQNAQANAQVSAVLRQVGEDDAVALQYHLRPEAGLPADPINALNPYDPSGRALFYGVAASPSTWVDGEPEAGGLQEVSLMERALGSPGLLGQAPFGVALGFEPQPEQTLNVRVRLQANQAIDVPVSLQVAVLEREVTAVAGSNGEARFEWVLRKLLPDPAGTAFSAPWQPGDTSVVRLSWPLVDIFDPGQVRVVAFVQHNGLGDPLYRQVYQAAYAVPEVLPQVITGLENVPEAFQSPRLYPNPTASHAYLALSKPAPAAFSWHLVNALGQTVREGVAPAGTEGVAIHVAGLPSGLYALQAVSEGRPVLGLKLLVRP